jgi:hypothetical protein
VSISQFSCGVEMFAVFLGLFELLGSASLSVLPRILPDDLAITLRYFVTISVDCLCGLVIRVPSYRSRGPRSIPGTTRFFEK